TGRAQQFPAAFVGEVLVDQDDVLHGFADKAIGAALLGAAAREGAGIVDPHAIARIDLARGVVGLAQQVGRLDREHVVVAGSIGGMNSQAAADVDGVVGGVDDAAVVDPGTRLGGHLIPGNQAADGLAAVAVLGLYRGV